MYSRLEKIPTQDLQTGLYVQQLDRPWTETPFVFQGFFIKSQDDIEELKHYCDYVFVDAWRSREKSMQGANSELRGEVSLPASGVIRFNGDESTMTRSEKSSQKRRTYEKTKQVEYEIVNAEIIHHEASHAANSMLSGLQKNGKLDINLADHAVKTMMDSVLRNPDAMIWLSKMRKFDGYIYQHSINCTIWSLAFARHLGLDKQAIYEIGLGCMLFDVGKLRLPGGLLIKAHALNHLEMRIVRSHVEYGLEILDKTEGLNQRVINMVSSHHERFNGSGYPEGLVGNAIPTFAKIAGIVDSYDAMISPRPYAKQHSPYEAVRQMYLWRGNLFQPEVIEQFMQVVGVFPTGTLVELSTGAVGVVISQNETRRLRPRIMLILDEKKRRLQHFEIVDLMEDTSWNNIQDIWINSQLPSGSYGIDPQKLYF